MAFKPTTLLLFTATLLLFTTTSPSGHVAAAIINGLTVRGHLCCTTNGNCPGQSLAGVGVRMNCTYLGLASTTVGIGTTDATGRYLINVPTLPGFTLPCSVNVRLPLEAAVCPALSATTGLLVGTLSVVGTEVNPVLGLVQLATVNAYVHVGV